MSVQSAFAVTALAVVEVDFRRVVTAIVSMQRGGSGA